MKDYLRALIEPILLEPQELEIEESQDEMGDLLSFRVSKTDMGRVIGKSGEIIKAIRSLVRVVGSRYDKRVAVKVNEPYAGRRK